MPPASCRLQLIYGRCRSQWSNVQTVQAKKTLQMAKAVVYKMHYVGMLRCLRHCTAVCSLPSCRTPIVHNNQFCGRLCRESDSWSAVNIHCSQTFNMVISRLDYRMLAYTFPNVLLMQPATTVAEFARRNTIATSSLTHMSVTRTTHINCVKQRCGATRAKNTCVFVKGLHVSVTTTRWRNFGDNMQYSNLFRIKTSTVEQMRRRHLITQKTHYFSLQAWFTMVYDYITVFFLHCIHVVNFLRFPSGAQGTRHRYPGTQGREGLGSFAPPPEVTPN